MTPDQWQRAKDLLVAVPALPVDQQRAVVIAAFPDDTLLQADVLRLLETTTRVVGGSRGDDTQTVGPMTATGPFLAPGQMCGPYRVIRTLGAGGMGHVFLAEDLRAQLPGLRARHVALKCPTGRWVESPDARYRLLLEFATAATLGTHAHIATAFDAMDSADGQLVLVMEYVDGAPLNRLVAKGPLPWRFALTLAIQIAEALGHAHDSNVLHCDIKAANVMVTAQNQAKMLDFGLSRARQLPGIDTGGRIGTLSYMAPERIIDGTLDVCGDLYGLGVTLFEMLAGRRPFNADSELDLIAEILEGTPPKVSALVPGLPLRVEQVVERALARDPRQRFQSAREFIAALRSILHKRELTLAERAARAGAIGAVLVAITLILGFISSTAINVGLGRTGGFEPDIRRSLFTWGAMSLFAPMVFIMLLLLGAVVVGITARLLCTIPIVRARVRLLGGWMSSAWRRVTPPPETLSQAVLLTHVAALAAFIWFFWPLIAAVAHFMAPSAPGDLAELPSANQAMHEHYRSMASLLIFFVVATSAWLLRHPSTNVERPGLATLGTVMTLALGLFLFALPFQVLFHNKAERVNSGAGVCYLTARSQEGRGRLFCPRAAASARLQTVGLSDPAVMRTGIVESVFTALNRPGESVPR